MRTIEKAKTCALRAREWRYNSKTVERVGRVYIIMFVSSCQLHESQNSRTLERDIRGHLKSHSRTLDLVWIPRYIGISTYKYKWCCHSAACHVLYLAPKVRLPRQYAECPVSALHSREDVVRVTA